MSFADVLRRAGSASTAVLHEFRIQHNPREERVHAFVEGAEDRIAINVAIAPYLNNRKAYFYVCDGKSGVLQALNDVGRVAGRYRHTLYFIDKDLSDILGEALPADDRLYITDWYSIENNFVEPRTLNAALQSFVVVRRCTLDFSPLRRKFERELSQFHKLMTTLMAWVVCARCNRRRVNLSNASLGRVFEFTDDLDVKWREDGFAQFRRDVGQATYSPPFTELLAKTRSLRLLHPKAFVRGKFELWFFVNFVKQAVDHLRSAAALHGGVVETTVPLEMRNAVSALAVHAEVPESLRDFMHRHLA
jgi:hypothetical protein